MKASDAVVNLLTFSVSVGYQGEGGGDKKKKIGTQPQIVGEHNLK